MITKLFHQFINEKPKRLSAINGSPLTDTFFLMVGRVFDLLHHSPKSSEP
jgi:hypothetical protein